MVEPVSGGLKAGRIVARELLEGDGLAREDLFHVT